MSHENVPRQPGASGPDLSRRRLLAGAGLAVGLGLASTEAPVEAAEEERVAVSPPGGTAVEFRCRIVQSGPSGEAFEGVGYLTAVHGLRSADLFASTSRTERSALFTTVAVGALVQRVLDQRVHALDIEGTLTVYQRTSPGASFDDPGSFGQGSVAAVYALTLQDILSVFAPAQGIPTLSGDIRQERADRLTGRLAPHIFGRRGTPGRLFATGLGTLTDPVTLNAQLEMAGNWTTSSR